MHKIPVKKRINRIAYVKACLVAIIIVLILISPVLWHNSSSFAFPPFESTEFLTLPLAKILKLYIFFKIMSSVFAVYVDFLCRLVYNIIVSNN